MDKFKFDALEEHLAKMAQDVVSRMSDEEKAQLHSDTTKETIGHFVQSLVFNDRTFGYCANTEASVVTGGGDVVYHITVKTEKATPEQKAVWEKENEKLNDKEVNN